jgi:3-phosphoshikimate 1-carboxyvinyltransferase
MIKEIISLTKPIDARVRVPGSKSITNRALICAALAKGDSILRNASDSNDTLLMINGLNQLGVLVRKKDDALLVQGTGGRLFASKFPIPVGNAGTTLRFLLSLAALAKGKTIFDCDMRMSERPNDDLVNCLTMLGATTEAVPHQSRFSVEGGTTIGGTVTVSGNKSSQFISSLLMIAPYANENITIAATGKLSSEPYITMTLAVMKHFGVSVERTSAQSFVVAAGVRYTPTEFRVEADASSASYFLAATAMCGGKMFVEGVGNSILQGDAKLIGILRTMGCRIIESDEGLELWHDGALQGVDVDMNDMPDIVPTLAVIALFAKSPTRIRNVAHLRHKESDRLHALEVELQKLGANINALDDGLEIFPTELHGGQLDTYDDHRLAMSFALIGLMVKGVIVENPECVKKSFPKFWEEFEKLRE